MLFQISVWANGVHIGFLTDLLQLIPAGSYSDRCKFTDYATAARKIHLADMCYDFLIEPIPTNEAERVEFDKYLKFCHNYKLFL